MTDTLDRTFGSDDNQRQMAMFDESPAAEWDRDSAHRALDDLFTNARQFKSSTEYHALLQFVTRFHFYSPFNAMLIRIQMKGATYVAPPYRWDRDYLRRIKPGARPIVILQPKGPVMFVFDVSDTEALEGAPALPRYVTHPLEVRSGVLGDQDVRTIENAKRDGVRVTDSEAGSQYGGQIGCVEPGAYMSVQTKWQPEPEYTKVPVRYEMVRNAEHSRESRYATLVHELGHLYCGHLGTPNEKWWPNRQGLDHAVREFEAESVCYLVCRRLGIDSPSDEYISGYMKNNAETPQISLDCVMKAAGLIEQMGRVHLKPRKKDEQ